MIKVLKRNWQTIVLTLIALAILRAEYLAAPITQRLTPIAITNPFFVATGKWGIRFLVLSLAITPIYTYTGWRFPIKLRKPAGLLAFMFVFVHAAIHVMNKGYYSDLNSSLVDRLVEPQFVIYGLAAFSILALMTLTSVKPMMKVMGRYWKPLHRLVYLASMLMMLHSITAATTGKRAVYGGEESVQELAIYLSILILLLFLRIPPVKRALRGGLAAAASPFQRRGPQPT